MRQLKILLLLSLLIPYTGNASHIKGGRIFYKYLGSNNVEITFVGYRDVGGVPFGSGVVYFGDGTSFGDSQNEDIPWDDFSIIDNETEKWTFTVSHTYTESDNYIISYSEMNRTSNIENINGSETSPFYVEALLVHDQFSQNNSASVLHYPNFSVPNNSQFETNLNVIDLDGDSLSYHLIVPKQAKNLDVSNYLFPSDATLSSQKTEFGIHPISGNLFWDKPEIAGQYAIAIKIKEWREIGGVRLLIGYTVVDYIFNVLDIESPPVITVPQTICHLSDKAYTEKITINNPGLYDLQVNFDADLTDLMIDGLTASEWNSTFSESRFSDRLIEFQLEIPIDKIKNIQGFNRTLISVSGEFNFSSNGSNGVTSINFTPAFLVSIGCNEQSLIPLSSSKTNKIILNYSKENISITSSAIGKHSIQIFNTSGKQLFQTQVENKDGICNIPYPFQPNTVYLISVENSSNNLIRKVNFN